MTRLLRFLAIVATLAIVLPSLAVLAVLGAAQVPAFQHWAEEWVESAASGEGMMADVEGLTVRWPLNVSARAVTLSDGGGGWLVLREVRMDWAPPALIQGILHIRRLEADEVRVLRRPGAERPQPAEAAPPSLDLSLPRPPAPPLAVQVDTASAGRVVLDRQVLGQAVEAALEGDGAVSGEGLRLSLRGHRTDGLASQAAVSLLWSRARDALDVNAALHSAPGGLAGRLLDLPDLPAVTLNIEGEGPLTDWRARIAGAAGDADCVEGTVSVAGAARGRRLGLDASLNPGCAPMPWRTALGDGAVRIAGKGVLADETLSLERLALDAEGLAASASGTLEPERVDLAAVLEAEEVAPLAEALAIPLTGHLATELHFTGPADLPAVAAAFSSRRGGSDGLVWSQASGRLEALPGEGGWRTALALRGDFGGEVLPSWLQGRIALSATGLADPASGAARLGQVSLSAPAGRLLGSGSFEAWGRSLALVATVTVPDAEPLGLGGSASLEASLRGDALAPDLEVSFSGTGRDLSVGEDRVDALIGRRPDLSGVAHFAEGALAASFRLDGAAASARAELLMGPWQDKPLVAWQVEMADLAALELAVSGPARVAGFLSGFDDDAAFGAVGTADLSMPGGGPYPLEAAMTGRLEPFQPHVAARTVINGIQTSANARLLPGEPLRLRDLKVSAGGGTVTGDLAVGGDGLLAGTLAGEGVPLAPWGTFAGVSLSGAADVTATLAPGRGGQGATIRARGTGLTVMDAAVDEARLDAELADLFGRTQGRAVVQAAGVRTGGVAIDRAGLRLTGPLEAPRFRLEADGEAAGPFALVAEGAIEEREVRVDSLRGSYAGRDFALAAPAALGWGGEGVRIGETVLTLGDGRLSFAGRFGEGALAAQGRLEAVPLDLAELAMPGRDLTGVVDGRFSAHGTLERPRIQARLEAVSMGIQGDPLVAGIDAQALLEWNGERLVVEASAAAEERGEATLTADLPLVMAIGGGVSMPEDQAVRARVKAEGRLAPVAEAVAPVGHLLEGRLSAEVGVAGTLAAPVLTGEVRLEEGRYENLAVGTVIRDIEAVARAEGAERFQVTASGAGPDGGRVTGAGTAELDADGLRYQLAVDLERLMAVQTPAAVARTSGSLTFAGLGSEAALSGTVRVDEAEYDLGASRGADVVSLDVVEINLPPGEREAAAAPVRAAGATERLSVALSIDVRARRVFVRGLGLDAEVRGDIIATGTAARPSLVGTLEVVRGSYDLIGRTFRLREGEIVFDGGAEVDPELNVVATAETPTLTVNANVSGRASAPRIDFTSEPPYPSDEVLARLLFGRELGQLSTAQQVQLARAVAALATGGGMGLDPIGRLRGALDLDVLEVSPGGNGEDGEAGGPAVSAGKYLDEDTFLRLEQGSGTGRVTVERRLGRGLSLESEIGGEGGGGGVGLKWQRDY